MSCASSNGPVIDKVICTLIVKDIGAQHRNTDHPLTLLLVSASNCTWEWMHRSKAHHWGRSIQIFE
eukprot:7152097-Ditylum_brightwellii.AAC.1